MADSRIAQEPLGDPGRGLGRGRRILGSCALLGASLGILGGCGFTFSTRDTTTQMKALSQVLREAQVETCTKVTAQVGPYAQVVTIWAGGASMADCLKALYPY